jgi:hypothetical protein
MADNKAPEIPTPPATPPDKPATPPATPPAKPKEVRKDVLGTPLSASENAALDLEAAKKKAMDEFIARSGKTVAELTASPVIGMEQSQFTEQPDGFKYALVEIVEIAPNGDYVKTNKRIQSYLGNNFEMVEQSHKSWDGIDKNLYCVMRKPIILSQQTHANAVRNLERVGEPKIKEESKLGDNSSFDTSAREMTIEEIHDAMPTQGGGEVKISSAELAAALQDQ